MLSAARAYHHTMPIEFLHGRVLDPEELDAIRQQIEDFDSIEAIDPEVRGIVERNWPHLMAKLPPDDG
ncbi:hypothetical protein ACQR1W_31460 [Bradyrhizobium sp. HKCCYLS1011]|uniref:hypothetical protein n=1 Tax=Bradyrhizobium sp. HKCCYLS1011 TaxID=3420733 RepID=UPI003EBD2B4B